MRIPVIPLLPDRIAVGLQSDLVDFVNEVKFLLLFFNKPLAFLSTVEFSFLTDELINIGKRGQPIITNFFDDTPNAGLKNIEILQTEEWDLIENNIDIYPMDFGVSDEKSHEDAQYSLENNVISAFDLFDSTVKKHDKKIMPTSYWSEQLHSSDRRKQKEAFLQFGKRLVFARLNAIIDACQKENIPMIWSDKDELGACEVFTKQYLNDLSLPKITENEKIENLIKARIILGDSFLQQIMQLEIINLSDVSVSNVIEFREKNKDLLYSFLLHYRTFLSAIEASPADFMEITRKYTNSIGGDFSTINRELGGLKRARNTKWLKFCSSEAGNFAKSSAWSMFVTPILLLYNIVIGGGKVAAEISDDLRLKQEILQRTSSGYLWEASKKFQKG